MKAFSNWTWEKKFHFCCSISSFSGVGISRGSIDLLLVMFNSFSKKILVRLRQGMTQFNHV